MENQIIPDDFDYNTMLEDKVKLHISQPDFESIDSGDKKSP